jgi:hypothetical protein
MVGGFCPQCGTQRQSTMRYCANCGFDFWKAAQPGSGQTPAAPPPSAKPPPPATPRVVEIPVLTQAARLFRALIYMVLIVAVAGVVVYWLSGPNSQPQTIGAGGLGGATATPFVEPSTPTPAPTVVSFTPIKLSGRGNKVPKFTIPADTAAIATISEKGSSNFDIISLAADGSENDLLVNVIGNYAGTVLFDANVGEHSVAFKVESNGSWTITISPLTAARKWDPTNRLSGKSDDVIQVSPPTSGLTTATITHKGSSNFAVIAYSQSTGTDLLVNEIGNYSGQSALPDGTFLLQVEADGTWTVSP